ncbi:hypothetical protein [Terrihabitans sp. B22-R8]|uniref:hypothetical protein n=1 Tax=Terrihabitans sp. B22-R8 TaxID=3425128 RepID=UPI00403CD896
MVAAIVVDPEVKVQARRLYEETSLPVEAIAGMLNMKPRTFHSYRARWGWVARLDRNGESDTGAADEVSILPTDALSDEALEERPSRAETIQRIRDIVEREVSGVEQTLRRMDRLAPRGDAEKAARTLASLVKTLTELQRLDANAAEQAKEPDDEIDIDEFRRELARRLDALCASRAAE